MNRFKSTTRYRTRKRVLRSGWRLTHRRHPVADPLTLEFCARIHRAHRKARTKHARMILDQWVAYLASLPAPEDISIMGIGDDVA